MGGKRNPPNKSEIPRSKGEDLAALQDSGLPEAQGSQGLCSPVGDEDGTFQNMWGLRVGLQLLTEAKREGLLRSSCASDSPCW